MGGKGRDLTFTKVSTKTGYPNKAKPKKLHRMEEILIVDLTTKIQNLIVKFTTNLKKELMCPSKFLLNPLSTLKDYKVTGDILIFTLLFLCHIITSTWTLCKYVKSSHIKMKPSYSQKGNSVSIFITGHQKCQANPVIY